MIALCRLFQACCYAIVAVAIWFTLMGVWPVVVSVPFFVALALAFGEAAKQERAARRAS